MERLNGLDAGFLYGETPEWHMHTGGLIVLDPPSDRPTDRAEALRERLRARIHLLGTFRRRLMKPPLGIGSPVWVDSSDLDLDAHVRPIAVPSPGGPREVAELVGHLFSTKLDRDRPLWEIWVLEGLRDGRSADLLKIHHSLVDGVRSARLYDAFFDLEPDAPAARPDSVDVFGGGMPSTAAMLAGTARSVAAAPVRVARLAGQFGAAMSRLGRLVLSSTGREITWPFLAPRTSLNRPLTSRRAFAFTTVSLSDVRAAKQALGVTVNDIALAVCAGAVRHYLEDRGQLPSRSLVAQIPVGVHRTDPSAEGNYVAATGTTLHTEIDDPAERLRAIHAAAGGAKAVQAALGDDIVIRALEAVPAPLLSAGVGLYRASGLGRIHPPIFNLIVSNVVGPPLPLYSAGSRLVATYAVGPLLLGCGLNITLTSYLDRVDFGVATCPDVVEDPWAIADAIPAALRELLDATGIRPVAASS